MIKSERRMVRLIPIVFIFLLAINIVSVSAITGSLGNARMILRANTGETIEKYVLVKNVNNESLKIGLRTSGDLVQYIKLKENEFTLAPGEDRKAYFTIKAPTNGTTESRIEVTFAKADGKGNGVGLASTIILIAENNSENANLFEKLDTKTGIFIGIVIGLILIVLLIKFKKRAVTK